MTAIQCISRDGCIDAGYCQYCGRCLRPAVVTYSEPRCPHGYVISDTTHQCPKCGPVEVVSSNEQVGPLGWTLEMFVRDGLDRCRKMAAAKTDEHRQGWLDDEWYWSEMLKRVQSETKANLNAECSGCGQRYEAIKGHVCPAVKTSGNEAARLVTSQREPPHCSTCSCGMETP